MMRNILLVVICLLLQATTLVSAAQSPREAHLYLAGFDAASAGKYAYLINSIRTMLTSRLAALENVTIEDRMLTEAELQNFLQGQDVGVKKAGLKTENVYLLQGEMFELAAGLNLQLALYPLKAEQDVVRFSGIARKPEELLDVVGTLVGDMKRTLSVGEKAAEVATKSEQTDQSNSGFVTAHPEAAYKKSQYSGTIMAAPDAPLSVSSIGAKRSMDIPGALETMATGDLDGDGVPEVLVLSGSTLKIFVVRERSLENIANYTLPRDLRYHAINVAQLVGAEQPEIYVSGTDGVYTASLILKWSASKGFTLVDKNIRWYIRPVEIAGEGWRLAGQKTGNEKSDAVSSGVYLLHRDNSGNLVKGGQLPLPPKVNLFDFLQVDLDGNGTQELAVIDRQQKVRVYNSNNELLWVSRKNYGGSQVYLGPSMGSATKKQTPTGLSEDEAIERTMIFVPPALKAADLDGDGALELIVSENKLSGLSYFHRLRMYNGGAVVGLSWKDAALHEVWRTGNYRGFIAGYGFDPLAGKTGDAASARLYIGSLPRAGSLMAFVPGSGLTRLTVYDLGFGSKKSIVK